MSVLALIWIYFTTIVVLLYFLIIVRFLVAWLREKDFIANTKIPKTTVSIIIPVRNEENTIKPRLLNLIALDYPTELYEMIVVDDGSDDGTVSKVAQVKKEDSAYRIQLIRSNGKGKKAALATGIQAASGKLIVTTDADCKNGKDWLSTLVGYYEADPGCPPKMMIGPVLSTRGKGLFQVFQSLEFLSLTASTAGAALSGNAIMCNGANLAYEKEAFLQVGGFDSLLASGDDVLLMHTFKKKFKNGVRYIRSKSALVETNPVGSLREYLSQRRRWVSKSVYYKDIFTIFVALVVFMTNLLLLVGMVWSCAESTLVEFMAVLFGSKITIDFFLLYLVALFYGNPKPLWTLLPAEILYAIYVSTITIIGWLPFNYSWKGRNIRV